MMAFTNRPGVRSTYNAPSRAHHGNIVIVVMAVFPSDVVADDAANDASDFRCRCALQAHHSAWLTSEAQGGSKGLLSRCRMSGFGIGPCSSSLTCTCTTIAMAAAQSFHQIPPDVVYTIFTYLDALSIIRVRQVGVQEPRYT